MNELHVVATKVDRMHIEYRCPICHSVHRNGSMGSTRNRVESRGSHCTVAKHDVEIHVTDATLRPKPDRKATAIAAKLI